jgi:hypothetical protein
MADSGAYHEVAAPSTESTTSSTSATKAVPEKRKGEAQSFKSFSVFTLFPKLAVELRLRIWRFSFPTRVFELSSKGGRTALTPHSASANPVALFINHESRSEALKVYRPLVRGSFWDACHRRKLIYFNPNNDIVRLREECHFWNASIVETFISGGGILDHIKHLTFTNVLWYDVHKFLAAPDGAMSFHCFKALETISLVFFENYPMGRESVAQDCKTEVERYLKEYKKANPDYKVPKIITFYPPFKREADCGRV